MLYSLFFTISCCMLISLAYFIHCMCKLVVTKVQRRAKHESYRELERLITRRIFIGYLTFDKTSPYDDEENRRCVSSTRSTENAENTNAINATKATDDQNSEADWESAHSSIPATPHPRTIKWATLPRPIRRPPTSNQPAGLQFAPSPMRSPRPNRPNRFNPPKRLRSPPLPPDFMTISNASIAPMAIPGQDFSSWIAVQPYLTAANGRTNRDEGKKDKAMDRSDANWREIDRLISNERGKYARDKKVLNAAREGAEMKRENGLIQSQEGCNTLSTGSGGFGAW